MSQSYSLDTVTLDGDSITSVSSSDSDATVTRNESFLSERSNITNGDIGSKVSQKHETDVDVKRVKPTIYDGSDSNSAGDTTPTVITNDVNENSIKKPTLNTANVNVSSNKNDQVNENKTNKFSDKDKVSGQTNEAFASDDDNVNLIHKRKSSVDDQRTPTPKSCLTPPRLRWEKSKDNLGKRVHWKRTTGVTMKWRRAFAMVRAELRAGHHCHVRRPKLLKNKKRSMVNFDFGKTVQEYVNPAFEFDDEGGGNGKFADIVDHIMKQPSVTDIHPYGRGNLYASIFEQRNLEAHADSGKLISWVVVVMMLVGLAGGIVMLAVSWETEQTVDSHIRINNTVYT